MINSSNSGRIERRGSRLVGAAGVRRRALASEAHRLGLLAVVVRGLGHEDGRVETGLCLGVRERLRAKPRQFGEDALELRPIDGLLRVHVLPDIRAVLALALQALERDDVAAARHLQPGEIVGPELEYVLATILGDAFLQVRQQVGTHCHDLVFRHVSRVDDRRLPPSCQSRDRPARCPGRR